MKKDKFFEKYIEKIVNLNKTILVVNKLLLNISGRTDIIAYYTQWLFNRFNDGYALVRNPYNYRNVKKIPLDRKSIDSLVFTSKDYKPILNNIDKFNEKYPIFCYYTITAYGSDIESNVATIDESIDTFIELSEIIGKEKLAWRFDPLLLTENYSVENLLDSFAYICSAIDNYTSFCVFSFIDMYDKLKTNFPELIPFTDAQIDYIIKSLGSIAQEFNMDIQGCLIREDYSKYGIKNSGCITTEILSKANNLHFKDLKHTGMRDGCKCLKWIDIGAYNTCVAGCKYCYANKNKSVALRNFKHHDKNSPILNSKITDDDNITQFKNESLLIDKNQSLLI